MNNFKDLLRDLGIESVKKWENEVNKDIDIQLTQFVVEDLEKLIEQYHDRFIKEIGKYFELEDK